MTHTWTNWSTLQRATPARIATPWTSAELYRIVQQAVAQGRRIKAVGSGHSFTGIALTDDILVDLSNYTGIVAVDPECQQVTVRSGTTLEQLAELLDDTGLAMQNLGDINKQTIAGAISTSTHGTGVGFGSLASQVVGLEIITGTGQILTVSAQHHPELLDALRVTLGAFGIITTVTVQLVPAYDLRVVEEHVGFEAVLEQWEALNAAHDHFEFFWFGHDDEVITKASQRLPVSAQRSSLRDQLQRHVVDDLITNTVLAGTCQLGRVKADWIPQLNRLCTLAWGRNEKRDHWSSAFVSARRVRFNEMEYALPFDAIPEVLAELRRLFRRGVISSTYPLEVRAAAADTAWLASNHGRPTGYIAVHEHFRQDYRPYFSFVEPILQAAGGRPHWGKLHTMDSQQLADLYPCWQHATTLREQLDPQRLFTNAYLTGVFGA